MQSFCLWWCCVGTGVVSDDDGGGGGGGVAAVCSHQVRWRWLHWEPRLSADNHTPPTWYNNSILISTFSSAHHQNNSSLLPTTSCEAELVCCSAAEAGWLGWGWRPPNWLPPHLQLGGAEPWSSCHFTPSSFHISTITQYSRQWCDQSIRNIITDIFITLEVETSEQNSTSGNRIVQIKHSNIEFKLSNILLFNKHRKIII